jgi:hypothetical protein
MKLLSLLEESSHGMKIFSEKKKLMEKTNQVLTINKLCLKRALDLNA